MGKVGQIMDFFLLFISLQNNKLDILRAPHVTEVL